MTKKEVEDRVAASASRLVLVDFHAAWCGTCKVMMPGIDKLDEEMGDQLHVIKINVDGDGNRDLAKAYGISSIPALFLYQDGRLVENNTFTGTIKNLNELVGKYVE